MKTKITSNVLDNISERLQGGGHYNNKALVVFNGSNIGLDKRIGEIRQLKEKGIGISIALSFMADKLLDKEKIISHLSPYNIYKEEDIFKLESIAREYSLIIGPNITINTLSKVSLSLIDSFIPNLIWTYLYKGKKVYLDFASVRKYLGEETENKEIENILENHIKTVKKMGVIELQEGNYLQLIHGVERDKTIEIKESIVTEDSKRVITESDILSMSPNKKIILPKGSIITPLARDKAREKNVQIEIKGG